MSIDAFTGRNPSYCFLDLHTQAEADLAVKTIQGQLVRDRPVKISLQTERQARGIHGKDSPKSPKDSPVLKRINSLRFRNDAKSHWTAPTLESRRLYVGGLPQISRQHVLNADMAALFEGYDIQAVSKLVWPHASKRMEPGSHYYAFVDLATAEAATDAVRKLDGTPAPHGGTYRISCSQRNKGSAIVHREQLQSSARITEARLFVGGLPELQDVDGNIRLIFTGRGVRYVGSLIKPPVAKQTGQHCFYCFVDFDSADEARAVVAAFEGNEIGLIVDFARDSGRGDGVQRGVSPPDVMQRDLSKSWRRQDVPGMA